MGDPAAVRDGFRKNLENNPMHSRTAPVITSLFAPLSQRTNPLTLFQFILP